MKDKTGEILEYIARYPGIFDKYEEQYIIQYIEDGRDDVFLPDLIRELYDKFGIVSDDENIYVGFLNLLRDNFDVVDSNIIEVGGGIFPSLGRKISLMQNRGTITVYDPRLSRYEAGNIHMRLVRLNFSHYMDIGDTNLMIGFMPCKGAEELVQSATDNGVDFMVALCEGGPHGDMYDYFESDQEWIDSMLYRASRGIEDHNMGSLEITYLEKYEDPYPVIYNKRK